MVGEGLFFGSGQSGKCGPSSFPQLSLISVLIGGTLCTFDRDMKKRSKTV